MKFLSVFRRIFSSSTLGHYPQSRYAISQSRNLVIQICPVPLLNHVVRRLLYWLVSVHIIVIVILVDLGGRLAFPAIQLRWPEAVW